MWIYCKYGFFSVVEHKDYKDKLLVRSRFKGDIEKLLCHCGLDDVCQTVKETPFADYAFRVVISRGALAKIMKRVSEEIDYHNFKDEVHEGNGSSRDSAYMNCWFAMRDAQNRSL